jgi:hypothetical protein
MEDEMGLLQMETRILSSVMQRSVVGLRRPQPRSRAAPQVNPTLFQRQMATLSSATRQILPVMSGSPSRKAQFCGSSTNWCWACPQVRITPCSRATCANSNQATTRQLQFTAMTMIWPLTFVTTMSMSCCKLEIHRQLCRFVRNARCSTRCSKQPNLVAHLTFPL